MPCQKDIVEISCAYGAEVFFVSSYSSLERERGPFVWHYVDTDKEAADLFIINHARDGDVAVTHDIGLAAILLSKKISVIDPRGTVYKEEEMPTALHRRYLAGKERRQGIYRKGPKKFTKEDRDRFCNNFRRILSKNEGKT